MNGLSRKLTFLAIGLLATGLLAAALFDVAHATLRGGLPPFAWMLP